jgi:TonB family protein
MFREMLLESAPGRRRRTRWPMAVAFTLEMIVATLLIVLPLFSSGVISASARVPPVTIQLDRVTIVDHHPPTGPTGGAGQGSPVAHPADVVTLSGGRSRIAVGPESPGPFDDPNPPRIEADGPGPRLPSCDGCRSNVTGPRGPGRISVISEGQILYRVEPVYPKIASLANIRGEVRLHAIIAKDGTIQSLSVISGHPILAKAAIEAVEQWRYRPYVLNKEPIEVETFITVNFKDAR